MSQVDVIIVTAIQAEYDAAKRAGLAVGGRPGIREWRDGEGDVPYVVGEYRAADGRIFSVALARSTRMGSLRTAPLATTLVDRLRPTCLAMSGVCAGNPDDHAPGDVVVADLVYEYDEGKLIGDAFEGDHRQYPQDVRWLRAAQDFVPERLPSFGSSPDDAAIWFLERLHNGQDPRTHPARARYFPRGTWPSRLSQLESAGLIRRAGAEWALTDDGSAHIQRVLYDDVDGPDRLPFVVTTGPMASGNAVVKDPAIWGRLKRMGVRRIAALEMEAATIATVAYELQVPHWIVAKGVMDHADFAKDDRYKEFAARASAEVLYALLARLVPAPSGVPASQPVNGVPANGGPGGIPGSVKVEITRRLSFDWQDLADYFGVPPFVKARFRTGDEPRELWEWLENRRRLPELPGALAEIGRDDLAELLRSSRG